LGQVVVVGSGAGGAVVARELAARGRDVVLVEEGGFFTGKDFSGNPRAMIDLLYRGRGLTGALGRPTIPIPLGRCVGGTTTINSGTCYRAPDYVLDEWAERYGVAGAREPDLRAYFERVEAELGVRPVPEDTYGRNSRLFERGAAALGYDGARIPRNERGCLGTGVCAIGCPQDAQQAMHVSYVPRAQAAGARLFTREGIFIQGQFVPPALEAPVLPGVGAANKQRMARFARLGSFGALISDESAGRVRAGRGRWPRVTYQLGPADARKLARAIGLTAEIFFAAGAREVYSGIHSRSVLRTIDEARAIQHATLPAADFEMMAFHPQGTARMGEDPRAAVTDSVGRV